MLFYRQYAVWSGRKNAKFEGCSTKIVDVVAKKLLENTWRRRNAQADASADRPETKSARREQAQCCTVFHTSGGGGLAGSDGPVRD